MRAVSLRDDDVGVNLAFAELSEVHYVADHAHFGTGLSLKLGS